MKLWICKNCDHEVVAEEKPTFTWDDGHNCVFEEAKEEDLMDIEDWAQGPPC